MSVFSFPAEVNERAARTVAGVVAVLGLVTGVTQFAPLAWVLAVGFLLRVGWGPRFSPLARFAVWLAPRFGAPVPVPGAPKRFAQGIGAVVTVFAAALLSANFATAASALLAVLVVFATLESVFAFCFGCWLYARLWPLAPAPAVE